MTCKDEIEIITKIKKERNMSTKIGKARYGSGSQRKYFKLKDGDQAFRILPPLGELADAGRWSVFYSVHYGYKTSDGKQKPFLSPEVKNRKNGMTEVADAAKDRIATLKVKWQEAKDSGNKAVFEKLNDLVGPTGMYNLDNNHYMNVVDPQGNIGILKLRHRAKLALETQIKALNAQGVDPLSVEDGRFFVFTRSGMGRDTTFAVSILKEKMNLDEATAKSFGLKAGAQVERDVVHSLNEEFISRLDTEAGELNKIFKRLSAEEVKAVVDGSDLMTGVSPILDALFGKAKATEAAGDEGYDDDTPNAVEAPVIQATAPKAVAPAPQEAPKAFIAPVQPKTSVTDMSSEDFLAALTNGTL
jgi:hypothetical protein